MLTRKNILIKADPNRVLLQFFNPGSEKRIKNIINRVFSINDDDVKYLQEKIQSAFINRHKNIKQKLEENFKRVELAIPEDFIISEDRKFLTGAYFSKEYSIASAALFNPSIIMHPDQSGLRESELRFIISLRATGEGHISSIEFRTGIVDKSGEITLDEPGRLIDSGKYIEGHENTLYQVEFEKSITLNSRVLFPNHPSESNGMEDARFVLFTEANGDKKYYATYTAYDGKNISVQLIETSDFLSFRIYKLTGEAASDKGMALFPEKINNKYYMISRQDGENLYIMKSDDLFNWNTKKHLYSPLNSWEWIQIGNCGSPIKTEQGWILITHAVGPLRTYVISALLLDLNDPEKIIGYLDMPLIEPDETEREGYVPNVVYSCGSLLHKENIIIPYAMSDSASSFAVIGKEELLNKFRKYIRSEK